VIRLRTEDLKKIILKTFRRREFYGYEAYKKLKSKDIKIEISRLYRVLNEMQREGLLDNRWERSQLGPRRRVYRRKRKERP